MDSESKSAATISSDISTLATEIIDFAQKIEDQSADVANLTNILEKISSYMATTAETAKNTTLIADNLNNLMGQQ